MNHSAVKLLAMTLTAAALAVSSAHAGTSQWPGENVPFDAAADEPQPFDSSAIDVADTRSHWLTAKYLGENVPSEAAADDQPSYVAFEDNFRTEETEVAGLMLELPDYFSETVSFPAMPDYVVDEPLMMVASLDPTQTP